MEVYCLVCHVPIRLTISLLLCPYVNGNLFKEVSSCPSNKEEWEDRAEKKECKEPIPDFMCAAIENQRRRFGEICTVGGLINKGECAVLDKDRYNLNSDKCYATSGCPSNAYPSIELFKYPVCYNNSRETTTPTFTIGTKQDEKITSTTPKKTERDGFVHAIAISTFTVFLCVLFVFLILWMKRRTSNQNIDLEDNVGDNPSPLLNTDSKLEAMFTQTISVLGGYMKFQLVKLSKVKNIRFHMITHSESLKLHFKENFDRMMNSSSVDWTEFDLDTVYTLLSNFCGIRCPDRNWGYKPTDEDISLGADIERIRILVNEYLDDKTFKMDEADQILERRMVKKEVNSPDIIDFDQETKLHYKKLKPNNDVKNGTVVTRGIGNILEKLKSKKIVTCHGAIGCGKTTALEYVTKKYRDDGWRIEWMEEFINKSFFNSLLVRESDKILICCDNLFGSFGCHVFSREIIDRFRYYMHTILTSDNNIKVLLGIHEHVIEEMSSKHSLVWQDYNVFVDLDSISQSEALLIYIMQQEKANIKQEYIPLDDFLEWIEYRSANVGTPYKTLMIAAAPDVFGTKAFCNQPFQQMTELFSILYYRDIEMFYSLFYIMCVGIFDKREDELKRGIANAIYPPLDKNTVEYYLPKLAPYIQNDSDTEEIKHEVISIALIHTFMMESRKPCSIFSACDIRGILELIRPDNQAEKRHQFAIPLSKETLDEAKTVLKTKIVQGKVDVTDHPLSELFS